MTGLLCSTECGGGLLRLTLDRPPGNILTGDLMAALSGKLIEAAREPELRLILIDASGAHFSFGAAVDEHTMDRVGGMLGKLRELVLAVSKCPVPVAAQVQGRCLGGAFELAMACHFILAADDARFAVPEIRLGVIPPVAAALLPRLCGGALAAGMIIGGEEAGADDLAAAGLVHRRFPAGELRSAVVKWFESTLGRCSAASLRVATLAARSSLNATLREDLLAMERVYMEHLEPLADAAEGIAAFMEKRRPVWRHG